jgi:hypothetical protein
MHQQRFQQNGTLRGRKPQKCLAVDSLQRIMDSVTGA